jgi:ribose transport system permease protein
MKHTAPHHPTLDELEVVALRADHDEPRSTRTVSGSAPEEVSGPTDVARGSSGRTLLRVATNFGLPITWLTAIVAFSIALPGLFLTTSNLAYILNSQATLLIVAIAVTIPFAAGEFDLSSSGVIIFVVVLVGYLNVLHEWPIGWTVLAALAAGLVIGAINAFMVVHLQISSLIATLAMSFVLGGLALGLNNATLVGISTDLINASRSTTSGGVQLVVWYALGVTAIAWYVFQHTTVGRKLFFTGAGREVARLSGVKVDAYRARSLIVCALLTAVAAVLQAGVLGAADPNVGASFTLAPFAAAMLGSTSFTPGRFNILGTAVATYFLATGIIGLQLLGLAGWVTQVFYGTALIVGVALSLFAARQEARSKRA